MGKIRNIYERMSPEKQEEMMQYVESIKEIKKKISEMLKEASVNEIGGPIRVDSMHLNTEEETFMGKQKITIRYTEQGIFYDMVYTDKSGKRQKFDNPAEAEEKLNTILDREENHNTLPTSWRQTMIDDLKKSLTNKGIISDIDYDTGLDRS